MQKLAVLAALGDYYLDNLTGYSRLKFTLQNVNDFFAELQSGGWKTAPPFYDASATKTNIITKLNEAIDNCSNPDDWLLFYFTGHASRQMQLDNNGNGKYLTYCVTYSNMLKQGYSPGLDEFLTEEDYNQIIQNFHQKVPQGHLITVLDCCHAFGMVENFADQAEYHSVIAACSDGYTAAYSRNSLFFTAFKRSWHLPLSQVASRTRSIMIQMQAPNNARIQIASNFKNQTLNS